MGGTAFLIALLEFYESFTLWWISCLCMISPKRFLTDPVTETPEVTATTSSQERFQACGGQTTLLTQLNMCSMMIRGGKRINIL